MNQDETIRDFIKHFKRAIAGEMEAMRARLGSFEVSLTGGQVLDGEPGDKAVYCIFELASTDEKLVVGMECSLRAGGEERLVKVAELTSLQVTLQCPEDFELPGGPATLVIYPWFLYERLATAVQNVTEEGYFPARALTLFGKRPPVYLPVGLKAAHNELNTSQAAAVRLCIQNDLAFVWGPPGTGKTTTLAHIVEELLAQGQRTLVLSTTNAAVDQALEKVARRPSLAAVIEEGKAVRVGRTDAATWGMGIKEVTAHLESGHRGRLERLLTRLPAVEGAELKCGKALAPFINAEELTKGDVFVFAKLPRPKIDLEGIFTPGRIKALSALPSEDLRRILAARKRRLSGVVNACQERMASLRKALARREMSVVERARLVLSTLTNAYFSPLLSKARFDAVVVDEASMAVLPALFYAACLASRKTIMVGDPCQLPSIVQSDEPYVRKVMSRNIFEVAVKDPLASPSVAMLEVQYRMHPAIGSLVSELFYAGRLKHGGAQAELDAISAREPYPGEALVVVDTAGGSVCRQSPRGSSRLNDETARICADLAVRAAEAGSVAVITPYADQAQAIRKLLREHGKAAADVECSTVHRFQGRERDTVILDTVDAEPMRPGVLLSERGEGSSARKLVNVAISRARGKLIIVSDVSYFLKHAPEGVVTKVISLALKKGRRHT